jgi:hypothetical protein
VSIRQAAGAAGVARSTAQRVASQVRNREATSFLSRLDPAPGAEHPDPALAVDEAFRASPERVEIAFWLAKTSVSPDDLHTYLEVVPLGRIYEVVDECRRRARTWAQMADGLERQARARSQAE